MGKYIIIFILWAIVTGVIVVATGAVSTDNITMPEIACANQEAKTIEPTSDDMPKQEVVTPTIDKKTDGFSCASFSGLKLIAKGIVTNIRYTGEKGVSGRTISFEIDGKPMTLSYDMTDSPSRIDCQIYNNGGKAGIVEGAYYYIYDWDNFRIVWSQTPKTLDKHGSLTEEQIIEQPKSQLILIGKGIITELRYVNNMGESIPCHTFDVDSSVYVQRFRFLLDGVETKVDNPNPWHGYFCSIYDAIEKSTGVIVEGHYYYIYNLDKKSLIFSEVPIELGNDNKIKFSNQ